MNVVVLMGRLTKDPDVRYSQGDNSQAIARYTLAVDRRRGRSKQGDQQTADFISCVVFGKAAEFAEKHLHKGTKLCVRGRIQTGSYTNKDGVKVYTTDVVVEDQEFAESKNPANPANSAPAPAAASAPAQAAGSGFEPVPADLDEELPFN